MSKPFVLVFFTLAALLPRPGQASDCEQELLTSYDYQFFGRAVGDAFGETSLIADLNDDGNVDLIIGAYGFSGYLGSCYSCGAVYVMFGPLPVGSRHDVAFAPADWMVSGRPTDSLGVELAVGDLDDDGVIDLLVGQRHGAVEVFFGPLAAGTAIDLRVSPADARIQEDYSDPLDTFMAVGDVSGDGVDDVLMVGRFNRRGAVGGGEVRGVLGPLGPGVRSLRDRPAEIVITGEDEDYLGARGIAAGDLTGDGIAELAMTTLLTPRKVHVLRGPIAAGERHLSTHPADVKLVSPGAYDNFGYGLAIADITGDSGNDLIVPAIVATVRPDRLYFGSVQLFEGNTLLEGPPIRTRDSADIVIEGAERGSLFGASVAALDVSGDHRADLVVGAPGSFEWGGDRLGKVHVLLGPLDSHGPRRELSVEPADALLPAPNGRAYGMGFGVGAGDLVGTSRNDIMAVSQHGSPTPGRGRASGQVVVIEADLGCVSCDDLHATVESAEWRTGGLLRSAHAKVDAACAALARVQHVTAGNIASALVHELAAQRDKGLSAADADCVLRCLDHWARANDVPVDALQEVIKNTR